ncbi:hypothetical protein [Helicobacter burdigaliensis]
MLWNGSFVAGLRKEGLEVVTFGYSNVCAAASIYSIKKNETIFNNADLIILGISEESGREWIYENNIRNFKWLYRELYSFNKKVLVLIWHYSCMYTVKYDGFHQAQCSFYGFNFIDIYNYCKDKQILDFYMNIPDCHHPMEYLCEKMAREIAKSMDNFKKPKKILEGLRKNPDFLIVDIANIVGLDKVKKVRNHLGYEKVYVLDKGNSLIIPKEYSGKYILCIHTWNLAGGIKEQSAFVCRNSHEEFVVSSWRWETFPEIYCKSFIIDDNTLIDTQINNEASKKYMIFSTDGNGIALIDFMIVDAEYIEKENIDDFKDCVLDKNYSYEHLLYFFDEYKRIIDDYNKKNKIIMGEVEKKKEKIEELQSLLSVLQKNNDFYNNYGTARERVYHHLSYKVGQATVRYSKGILGYIILPFVLMCVVVAHKTGYRKPNKKVLLLEQYPDSQEAYKIKQYFSYKLGEILVEAGKKWYRGGFFTMWRKINQLKKENNVS